MSRTIKLNRGFNIRLLGEAEKVHFSQVDQPATFAIKPTDFSGIKPKLLVNVGDEVKAGTPLFHCRDREQIQVCAPVSGEIVAINRGPRRVLEDIRILADKEPAFENFGSEAPASLTAEQIKEKLLKSGAWPFLRMRPFSHVARPEDTPKSIFISAFDTAPLAPDYDYVVHGHQEAFQTGIDALKKLTTGLVHLNLRSGEAHSRVFTNARQVQINYFKGPHPAGNVGVQIHHLDPINKGDVVWYINPADVLIIGRLFLEGQLNTERLFAITGSEVKHRKYFKSRIGACIDTVLHNNLEDGKKRFISGHVLNGTRISENGYLGYYAHQLTVIPEGDTPEFFGWLTPGFDRPSASRALMSYLIPGKKFKVNTNTHGEERAFVVSGEYEKVLPMDIYPVHLLKSILYEDIEQMEGLGIYEMAPEDMALCEFVCTSKIPVQSILQSGLDLVERECF